MTTRLIRTLTGAALCVSLASTAHADTIFGFYAGASAWSSSISGEFGTGDASVIDTEDTLNLDDDTPSTVYVAVEHAVPLLPNVRFAFTDMSYSGSTTLASGITFDDVNFTAGSALSSELDFSHNDVTLYYELLDNVVSLDAGVNVRIFDGAITLQAPGSALASIQIDEAVPMLYGALRADLPLTGLYVSAEGNFLSIGDNDMQDLTAKVGYTIAGGFGVEGGYRVLRLNLEDINSLDSELDVDGAYASATFHF